MVDRKYKSRHKKTARARTTARQPSVDPQAGLTREKLEVLLSNTSDKTQATNFCELEFKECIHKLKDKKECKSRKKKCIKNLYNKLKITPRGSSRRTSGCTSSRCTSRSISRGSTRGSFLRPSKSARLSKAGSKKLFSLDRLESRNKKFFSESLPRRKRTLKQKVLDLQKKNKEHARQVKEERKYLQGSKKKRRRKRRKK